MNKVVLSLCDRTGNMVQPWLAAGYEAITVDLQPSDERADFRSATPMGFARAVFAANDKERSAE